MRGGAKLVVLFLLLSVLLFSLAAVQRAGEIGKQLERIIATFPVQTPISPRAERSYVRVDILPSKESLPKSRGLAWGTCYHLNYEDWGWMPRDALKTLLLAAAQNSRCVLLYVQPGTAANIQFLDAFLEEARGAGINKIVLRIDIRPDWGAAERVGRDAGLDAISQAYGQWILDWRGGEGEILADTYGMKLARMGVYVQLLNEPNVADEWRNSPLDRFSRTDPSGARLYGGDFSSLGAMVCRFYAGYVNALFPPMAWRDMWGNVQYRTDVPQPMLVIPDLAAASADEKKAYLGGCLGEIAKIYAGYPEYVIYSLRGAQFSYGFHIYLPCTTDPASLSKQAKEYHIDDVTSLLRGYSPSGLPFITDVLITEFGGSFSPSGGCDRQKQKDLYAVFTAMYPEIPAFWWVFAAPNCQNGSYNANSPSEWEKAALVAYRREGGGIVISACEKP